MGTTLLIMAAGIGSRFGTGIKQLAPVDDGQHIVMDCSIHDAIKAGFKGIIYIDGNQGDNTIKAGLRDWLDEMNKN